MLQRPALSLRSIQPPTQSSGEIHGNHTSLSHLFAILFPLTLSTNIHSCYIMPGKVHISVYFTSVCYRFDVHEFVLLNPPLLSASMILCINKLRMFVSPCVVSFPIFKQNINECSLVLILHNLMTSSSATVFSTALVTLQVFITPNCHHPSERLL